MKRVEKLYRLAEKHHHAICPFPLSSTKALTVLDPATLQFTIGVDPKQLDGGQKELLCLAHELGHCETGAVYNAYALCDVKEKHEKTAQRWAYQRLLPWRELCKAQKKGYTEPWQLAEYFDLPEDFIRQALAFYQESQSMACERRPR